MKPNKVKTTMINLATMCKKLKKTQEFKKGQNNKSKIKKNLLEKVSNELERLFLN